MKKPITISVLLIICSLGYAQRFEQSENLIVIHSKDKISQNAFRTVGENEVKTDSYNLVADIQYDITGINAGTNLNTCVRVVVDKAQSWAYDLSETEQTYAQMQIEVYEIHARRLRRKLAENRNSISSKGRSFHEEARTQAKAMIDTMNRETDFGRDYEKMDDWKPVLEESLTGLANYQN